MAAAWITVLKHNVPWGPFTRAQIHERLEQGDITLQSLAHTPGLNEWLPLRDVLDHLDRNELPPLPITRDLPPIPEPAATAAGPKSPALEPPPLSPPIMPAPAPPVVEEPPPRSEPDLPTASFLLRGIAFLLDCAILFVPIFVLFLLGAMIVEVQGWWQHDDGESMRQERALLWRNFTQLLLLVAVGFGWLYAAGLECSRWQATLGKRWVGIKVTDIYGERLSFLRATGRYVAKYLSALPCFLGFIMALFSSRGLALHDRLAKTRAVRE